MTLTDVDLTISQYDSFAANNDAFGLARFVYRGNDFIRGSYADDIIFAFDGDDTIYASLPTTYQDGNDILYGGRGNDIVYGFSGSDLLIGGQEYNDFADGHDTIAGGMGNDIIVGSGGNDQLTGGDGNDVFVFSAGHGTDVITDFQENDIISAQATSYSIAASDGHHTYVTLDNDVGLLLLWTAPDNLSESDFFFWS